ncbi:hypothetical protein SO694_00150064 [Aureococcus anophagefferens]|uniref:Uncharacterized protein n=1 Tax=Aureococcus anophagefferens TaxID=44056 RepID=A0ABR1GF14_AURAN
MAPEKGKFPSAADRYKIVNAIGADDLRKKELQERKERERDALLERLREERANPTPVEEAPAERPKQVYLAYKQNGGDADDGSRLTIKLTIPPAWLDKPCAKLARVRRREGPRAPARRRADGVLFAPRELIRDVVGVDMETLFVVDPTKLDSRSTIKAVSLHYKVEIERGRGVLCFPPRGPSSRGRARRSGVVVKSSPLAANRDGSKPFTFGVKGKWCCVEVEVVKDGWLKLSRNEVLSYKGTHTYEAIAEARGGEEFVECWMPAAHLKPVIVNPLVDDNASLVPVAVVDPNEKKRRGLRPSERRALRDAGLDDSQIQKPKPKLRR